MSEQFRSLIINSGEIQQQIDRDHRRRPQDFMRLMRLKLVRQRSKDRLRLLAAAARRPGADDSGGAAPASAGPAPHRSPSMVFPCL